jgi:hypothetical protein
MLLCFQVTCPGDETTQHTVAGLVFRQDERLPYVNVSHRTTGVNMEMTTFMQIPAVCVKLVSPDVPTGIPPAPSGDFKTAAGIYWAFSCLKDWLRPNPSTCRSNKPMLTPRGLCISNTTTRPFFGKL